MVDAGSEPTYAEKIRVPPTPWGNYMVPGFSKELMRTAVDNENQLTMHYFWLDY